MANKGEAEDWPMYVELTNAGDLGGPINDTSVGLYKADGTTQIDPATEQKQDDTITALGTVDTSVGAVNTTLTNGTLLTATETWEALKVGTAPSLNHTFNMEASGVYRYHAFAVRGTATSASAWTVMRIEFTDSNREDAVQFLVNEAMAYDDRVSGGTEGWTP